MSATTDEGPVQLRSFGEVFRRGLIQRFPDRPDEGLFERVAREKRLPRPGPLVPTEPAQIAEWHRWLYRVWAAYPVWGYCSYFIGDHARPVLPRVLAEIGLGQLQGFVSDDPADAYAYGIPLPDAEDALAWGWAWVVAHAPAPHLVPLTRIRPQHGGPGMCFRLTRDPGAPLLFLCEATHQWWCPALARKGACLVDLAAWRWDVTPAKAARQMARLLGLGRAVP